MTPLRKQLQQAAAEHRSLRYPGDLAIDVLEHHHRPILRRILWVGGLTATALAAAIALMVLLHRPPPGTIGTQPEVEQPLAQFVVPAMPEMPEGVPLSPPPYASLENIPARPEFPSRFSI